MSSVPVSDGQAARPGVILGLVVIGGVIGVFARALLLLPFDNAGAAPWAIAAINVLGSLLLGIVVGRLGDRHARARALLGTGVLGGFTTYSAFAVQTAVAWATGLWPALLLVVASVGLGLAGAAAGALIGLRAPGAPDDIGSPESAE